MQKRRVLSVLLIVFMTVCVLPFMSEDALAETKTFREISIDYGSASLADGDGNFVLLTYTSNSTLTLGEPVRARVLVVGGGGSGSSGKKAAPLKK